MLKKSRGTHLYNYIPEVFDFAGKPLPDGDEQFSPKCLLRQDDVRSAADGLVLRQGAEDNLGRGTGVLQDHLGKLPDSALLRVAQVHRPERVMHSRL